MLRLALCDDDPQQRAAVGALLQEYAALRPALAVKLSIFSSSWELLADDEEGACFDLYVLDVVMPEVSGIELGVKLRELGRSGAIIYLTISPEYAVDSYAAQAFYYLMKPVEPERLYQVLDQAVAALEKRKAASITVKTKDSLQLVRLDSILYAELVGRTVRYHLAGGEQLDTVTQRCSFQEAVSPLLAQPGFFACGASFVVNLYYVTSVEKRFLLLDGQLKVPLARGLAAQARQQWSDFWLNGMKEGPL